MSEFVANKKQIETFSFIGAGNMAYAILNGMLKSPDRPKKMLVYDVAEERKQLFSQLGCIAVNSAAEAVEAADYVLFAVKPQNMDTVMDEIKGVITPEKVLVFIVAGMTSQYVERTVGFECKTVLVMPNTPFLIGCGAAAVSATKTVSQEEYALAKSIFAGSGIVEDIPRDKMREVIPVNGSSPAFIYYYVKLFVDKADEMGIDREVAMRLFCNTMIGSARMMLESGKTPDELIKAVCSPGGTTLKGMEQLEKGEFKAAVDSCIEQCVNRAYELSKQ
ncbi:MAG: pyrroline-5-carboxylate reductase [Oscillospiraceae bacterium]|nr:pyrroline-5-carboxylate reductase [Oscillospiraceae bacterium]